MYALFDGEDKSRGAFPIDPRRAEELNDKGFGIYCSVNEFFSSRRVEENVKKLSYWFIDIDGQDKDMTMLKLKFTLTPTIIVETKNGHHAYWACRDDLIETLGRQEAMERYKNILERLVLFFNADKNAKGTTRILRVPGFYHMKDPLNRFMIKEVHRASIDYTLRQMDMALPEIEVAKKTSGVLFKSNGDDFWENVFNMDCVEAMGVLSGARECGGDVISFIESSGGKKIIVVNGKRVSGCWIDKDNRIGSFSSGGPSIAQWVKWYGHSWGEVASILKSYFPGLQDMDESGLDNFLEACHCR